MYILTYCIVKEQEENIERSKIYLEILNKQAKVVDDLKCKQRKDAEVKYNLRIEEIERSEELMRELEEELERDIIYIKELDEEKEIDRKKRICIEEELVEYNIELREIEFVEEERRSKMEIQSKEYEKELKQEAKMKVIVKDSIERPPMAKRYHKAAHNEVVELKGNIRVFCRQRPPLLGEQILGSVPQEKPDEHFRILNDRHHIEVKLATERTLMGNTLANHPTVKRFQFDHIFKSYEGQESIFKEVGPFINCVLDGYNVCIFAYGQTGSGKTYTMEGGNDIYTPEQIGIIPRAVNLIFCQLNYQRAMGWEVELAASFIQIYCGIVKDLLNPGNQCADQTKLSKFIPKTEIVRTDKKILELMKMARGNRNVGKTLMNDESSRSHSIFKLELQGKNELTGDVIKSALNLIDLAGSERIALSQVVGQQMKETQYINKSLTNLKAVIHNLATNQPHVPFRNDKLTTILEPYLGGNCKTLMFVNISSYIAHKQETINSLQFALEANNTYLGNLDKEGGNPKAGKFIMKKM